MIDFDATIQKFLADAGQFLKKAKPYDKEEKRAILKNSLIISEVLKYEPEKLQELIHSNTITEAGFIKHGSTANQVWLAFKNVANAMDDYYDTDNYNKDENLLKAIKRWELTRSNNMVKNFAANFMPLSHYAVKTKTSGRAE